MSSGVYFFRFVDGEPVELDFARFRRVIEPYVVAGGPDCGETVLRAEDGGTVEFYARAEGTVGPKDLLAMHVSYGAVLDILARLADALGAVIVPVGGSALILHEDQRRHLPSVIRADAIVVAPTGPAVQAGFDAG
ncbi:hypothetical protein AB0B13_36305 [Streptomyces sp. NPDC042898]|uniref:hypothetical protein n=1 Tax=unclassified Streptomyces TaxID=2593676 RepID=UPI00332FAA2D